MPVAKGDIVIVTTEVCSRGGMESGLKRHTSSSIRYEELPEGGHDQPNNQKPYSASGFWRYLAGFSSRHSLADRNSLDRLSGIC
jgi:hypothetical protein